MLSFLFKTRKKIDAFATRMADDFFSAIPQDVAKQYLGGIKDKKKTKAVNSKINDTAIQFQQFKISEKLGIYGKARLHLSFMNRLELLGYDQALAKKINEIILLDNR